MVQINIDISIFNNQILRRTFTYAQKPQHTHVAFFCTLLPEELGVMTQVFVFFTLLSWILMALSIVPYTDIMRINDAFDFSFH